MQRPGGRGVFTHQNKMQGVKTSFLVTHDTFPTGRTGFTRLLLPGDVAPRGRAVRPRQSALVGPNHREQNIMLFLFCDLRPIPATANSPGCGLSFGAGLQSRQGG